MTCRELVELVTDYLEGALPEYERARFEAHLSECLACQLYVAQMRSTIGLAGATAQLGERPDVSALLDTFRDWKRTA